MLTANSKEAQSGQPQLQLTANQAPVVSLIAPSANSVLVAPANVSLAASASDADGSIAKVEFFQGTTLLGTATAAPYTVTWSNVAAGRYSF